MAVIATRTLEGSWGAPYEEAILSRVTGQGQATETSEP
jgi:hypothetical protein